MLMTVVEVNSSSSSCSKNGVDNVCMVFLKN